MSTFSIESNLKLQIHNISERSSKYHQPDELSFDGNQIIILVNLFTIASVLFKFKPPNQFLHLCSMVIRLIIQKAQSQKQERSQGRCNGAFAPQAKTDPRVIIERSIIERSIIDIYIIETSFYRMVFLSKS